MPYKETIVVVGMGPSGFAYLVTEAKSGRLSGKRIIVLEKGKSLIEGNIRPHSEVNYGMGGAGTYSDGKMVASTTVGGTIKNISKEEYFALADRALELMESFYPGHDGFEFKWSEPDTYLIPEGIGLTWNPTKVCHVGTERARIIVMEIEKYLRTFPNIQFVFEAEVTQIVREEGLDKVLVIWNNISADQSDNAGSGDFIHGGVLYADRVINSAPNIIRASKTREVHLGFRTESDDYNKYNPIIQSNYDFKLSKEFGHARARTFCACSNGAKVTPQLNGGKYSSWNGHGLADGTHDKVNFGILVTYNTEETPEQLDERMRKLNEAYPNSPYPISVIRESEFADHYPVANELIAFVEELDKLVGITDERIYIPEIEVVQKGLDVKRNFEMVEYPKVYTIGTASGYARSIIQALVSGILASEEADLW